MARKKIDRKDKQCHLEYVWLAPSEYAHLEQLLGKAELESWIVKLNGYIGSIEKDPYASHYYTIQNWARREKEKTEGYRAQVQKASNDEAIKSVSRVVEAAHAGL
jgi:hypothetical protein